MLSQGYKISDRDHCLYTNQANHVNFIILNFYVDDMLIARTSFDEVANLKSKLHAGFDMKDFGDANHILGMCIVQNREKKMLFLSQPEYIGKVLLHFNMEGGKVWSTLLPFHI